jgi:starvation-inducible DNA-binding protein
LIFVICVSYLSQLIDLKDQALTRQNYLKKCQSLGNLVMQKINIGLTDVQRQGVVNLLNRGLADTYLLLVKTKKYRRNVLEPQFMPLLKLWQEHYADSIAERVRTLGGYSVGTMEGFLKISFLKEHLDNIPTATDMVTQLLEDHEQIVRNLREQIEQCSTEFEDDETAGFLTSLMVQHEETAWMLRSFIEGEAIESDGLKPNQEKKMVGV